MHATRIFPVSAGNQRNNPAVIFTNYKSAQNATFIIVQNVESREITKKDLHAYGMRAILKAQRGTH
jgi:hypothetical protein